MAWWGECTKMQKIKLPFLSMTSFNFYIIRSPRRESMDKRGKLLPPKPRNRSSTEKIEKDIFFQNLQNVQKKKKKSFQDDPRPLCNFTFIGNATNLPNTDIRSQCIGKEWVDPYCTFFLFRISRRRDRVSTFHIQTSHHHHKQSQVN